MQRAVSRKLAEWFGIDLRSLALVRIGLGLLLLEDIGRRALELRSQYTDFGMLPSATLRGYGPDSFYTPHGLLSGSPSAVGALSVLAALAAVALLVGWRTRAATVLSWVLLASIQWRNPPLNNGGDVMLRMMLFWGAFLPLDARFSWTSRRRGPPAGDAYVSAATIAFLLQLCFVYGFAIANRTGPTWWNGEALWYALHFDLFATPMAVWFRDFASILPPLTLAALGLELLGPLLAFMPVLTGPFRCAAILLFWTLHLSIAALFYLGHFQAVFMVAWLAFLPAWFWDTVVVRWRDTRASVALVQGAPRAIEPGPRGRRARDVVVASLLAYVVLCNLNTVGLPLFERRWPPAWTAAAEWLRIDQRWGLFAPNPPVNDGWYVIAGRLANGREINVLSPDAPLSFDKPRVVSASMPIHLRYFFIALELDPADPRWRDYGTYVCRDWNEGHAGDERMGGVNVYFVHETTVRPAPRRGQVQTLLVHTCS